MKITLRLNVFRYLCIKKVTPEFKIYCSTMPKPGFYAVRTGKIPGVYGSWSECEAQVKGFPNAQYKKFPDESLALEFIADFSRSQASHDKSTEPKKVLDNEDYVFDDAIFNDAFFDDVMDSEFNASEIPKNIDNSQLSKATHSKTSETPKIVNNSHFSSASFYAVYKGKKRGVYRTWTECEAQVVGVRNPSFRKFDNEKDALEYVKTGGIVKASKRDLSDIKDSNHVVKRLKVSDSEVEEGKDSEYVLVDPEEPVVVFTDGASSENGSRRACAGIGVYWGRDHPLNTSKRLTGRQTNNRAEIYAAIHALKQAKQINAKRVRLFTDSQFLIHGITDWIKKWRENGWKLANGDPVVNKYDFKELDRARRGLEVEWIYVRAHDNNLGNEMADRLAVAGTMLPLEPEKHSKKEAKVHKESFILTSEDEKESVPLVYASPTKGTFYAVRHGKCPGVYETWTECEKQVTGVQNASYRKFSSEKEALEFVKTGGITKEDFKVPSLDPDQFVSVYTDGASSSNGKDDARAGIGVFWGPDNPLNTSMRLPGRQTNNRAEIHAAVHALKQAKMLNLQNVRLYTDSQFVINGITKWIKRWKVNGWKLSNGGQVVNKEDFIALECACQGLNIDWKYVKGHDNNPGNVEADKLAVAGCWKTLSETIVFA